jgi:hypothetical protein
VSAEELAAHAADAFPSIPPDDSDQIAVGESGTRVEGAGTPVLGEGGRWYCGGKLRDGVYFNGKHRSCAGTRCRCDGRCGPCNGCQCGACYMRTFPPGEWIVKTEHMLRTRQAVRKEWLAQQEREEREREESRQEERCKAAKAAGEEEPREQAAYEVAECEVRRLHGEGHAHLAPLDAAAFALDQGHAAAAWRAAAAPDPAYGLAQFVTTSDRFESGAHNFVAGMMGGAFRAGEVADGQRRMNRDQDSRQRRARARELGRWRQRRDEAVHMLANSLAVLVSPPADLAAERCEAVRGEALCMLAADGNLAGVCGLLEAGVASGSAGLPRPVGLRWIKLDERPVGMAQVPLSSEGAKELAEDLAHGQRSFNEDDLDRWSRRGFELGFEEASAGVYVETRGSSDEDDEGAHKGGEFFKPVVGAIEWARVAASEGRGEGAAVLEELKRRVRGL